MFWLGEAAHGKDHPWVLINNPAKRKGAAVVVNITSWRDGADTTCVFQGGEHPSVPHKSYVRYRSARGLTTRELDFFLKKDLLRRCAPAKGSFLSDIVAGAHAAPLFPQELKQYL
jgi:hypothetical protein